MAATVETRIFHGESPGDGVVATNVRFKLADNNAQDVNNPVVRPDAGTNYSYWKTIALHCTVAPDNAINNVKLYSDGALSWTGCTVYVGNETPGAYQQATGAGDSGDEMVASHSGITGKADMFSYTSTSPKSVSGSISYVTGRISDYVIQQSALTSSAVAGNKPTETLTWQYDET